MTVTGVTLSESPYQLIVKYFLAYCLWIVASNMFFSLSVIMSAMQKKVIESMKNSIEIKYGGNGSYGGDGNDSSDGSNDIEKACNTLLEMLATYWHMSP